MTVLERYDNIYRFTGTVNNRPVNTTAFDSDPSSRKEGDWSGTKTWDEAVKQFENGIPERAEALKQAIKLTKVNSAAYAQQNRVNRRNYYYGYAPNVANAIIGLPKSMRQIHRTPQKVKAISLYWTPTVASSVSAETIQKAGETVLQLIYNLELAGYRVALIAIPFASTEGNETIISLVTLKEFKQPLDMLKLSFPMSSPAFMRRFGFAWAEGLKELTSRDWRYGYGHVMAKSDILGKLNENGVVTKGSYTIEVRDCESADFNPLKLAKDLGISI